MSVLTVRKVYETIDQIAPFDTAEGFDNAGMLLGRADAPIDTILCALDVTMEVVQEAKALKAQLIVSHHPLMFHAIHSLLEGSPENDVLCEMIRSSLSLISAHTNLDRSPLSGSACAAKLLGLKDVRQEGYLFIGETDAPMRASALEQMIQKKLHAPVRLFGDEEKLIHRLAIAGGAYGEGYMEALNAGADAYMTGEIRHHEAVDACARGLVLFEGGHYATEAPLVSPLSGYLQNALNALQYNVRVFPSTCVAYRGALD